MRHKWTAATAQPALVFFCDFLETRVETAHVAILRRIVLEYLSVPHEFATIHDMLQLAFPTVAVLPIEKVDRAQRKRAAAVLASMRKTAHLAAENMHSFDMFTDAVGARVELKNWEWLRPIFAEFCVGHETTIAVFAQQQGQAISLLPVPSQAAPIKREAKLSLVKAEATTAMRKTKTEECKMEISRPGYTCVPTFSHGYGSDEETTSNDGNEHVISPDRVSNTMQLVHASREILLAEYKSIEAQSPWLEVLDFSVMQLPFTEAEHPRFFRKFRRFWTKHARAVWERHFWYRYDASYVQETEKRRRRQDNAIQSFDKTLLEPIFETFGARFFVDLDARRDRAEWWWYRSPIVNITRLCDVVGLDASLRYLRSQARARFPATPHCARLRAERHHLDLRSMWSIKRKHEDIADEIDWLKQATASGANTKS